VTVHEYGEVAPYWQCDALVGEVGFCGERWSLPVKAHLAAQPYGRSAAAGLFPRAAARGVCTAVDARAYILLPDITVDVALRPPERASDNIGTVAASQWEGMKTADAGRATAFYYHVEDLLCAGFPTRGSSSPPPTIRSTSRPPVSASSPGSATTG
jgi:hypothetical protein